MIKGRNKRGLSSVISNLLLVLLVLVSVGVIWVVVRNVISGGSSQINAGQFTLDLSIQKTYVSGTDIVVVVRRNAGAGNLLGTKFLFINKTGSITVEKRVPLQELEEKTFTFTSSEVPGIGEGDEVSISPIYDSSGSEKLGGVTDSATISGTPPGSGGIGNPGTGFCGDSAIQNPNSQGINELCDLNNLGGQTCSGLGFTGGGTPSCLPDCTGFDTSQCMGATPPSCNGTWAPPEDPNVKCDGTPLPHGCTATCSCETGFNSSGTGGCNLNPPINIGIINSVWNNIFLDSNNLPKNSSITNYIGDYSNFSNSPETKCFLITFAAFVANNNISYLRLDDSFGLPNISSNQGFSVWGAPNCGQ
jgi:hypothetical protein